MHDDHHHGHGHGHHHHYGDDHHHHPHPPGHNGPAAKPLQWQTPHLPADQAQPPPVDPATVDLDLVETAFLEGFARAPDASSFLRLAGISFVGEAADGTRLHLLRVETEDMVDVGAIMPLVGGAGVAYHPLPARLTSHRRRLAFVYHDGTGLKHLGFAAARALKDASAASQFAIPGATSGRRSPPHNRRGQTMKNVIRPLGIVASSFAALTPSLAFAHSGGGHVHGLVSGLEHPMMGLDHLLAMMAVGMIAVRTGGRGDLIVPLSFVSAMVAGALSAWPA